MSNSIAHDISRAIGDVDFVNFATTRDGHFRDFRTQVYAHATTLSEDVLNIRLEAIRVCSSCFRDELGYARQGGHRFASALNPPLSYRSSCSFVSKLRPTTKAATKKLGTNAPPASGLG